MIEYRLGDWRDVLPGTYDPAAAVVITDPPYGLGPRDIDRGYADDRPWADHVRDVLAGLPAARYLIRGPATEIARATYPRPRRIVVEASGYRRRAVHRPGVVPYMWQGWLVYGRLKIGRRRSPPSGDVVLVNPYRDPAGASVAAGDHRGTTPWESARAIVETWCEPGWTILDPFAGLGKIGRAAAALGHAYIGAEIVPTWHATALDLARHDRPTLDL